jgi:putative ABC transport system permease protein
MLDTALKITLRSLYRDKRYALINLAGLSIAIACCLVLALYLRSELAYDRHNLQHQRIFRVANEFTTNGKLNRFAVTSASLGPMLKEQFADVQAYVRFQSVGERLIRVGDEAAYWRNAYAVDDNVFDVFTHTVLAGDARTALAGPSSVAVSESFARRYFGSRNPLGQTIALDNGEPREITLVFADLPESSHVKYDLLFSRNGPLFADPSDDNLRRQQLFSIGVMTYVLMPEGYDLRAFDDISQQFFDRNMKALGDAIDQTWRGWLEPLADIHLHSNLVGDLPTGNLAYLYGFSIVAVFILLVASINYMNLATARATKRAKEVGLRKVLGASRAVLALQFLAEAVVLTVVALVAGVLLVEVLLNATPINDLFGKPLALRVAAEPALLGAALGAAVVVGLLSGAYPAIYLSSMLPVAALVASGKSSARSIGTRQFLVFVQFTITVCVIACTLLMAAQMRFLASKSLGFAPENRLMVTLRGVDLIERIPVLRNELTAHPRVLGVTASASMMGQNFPTNVVQVENNLGTMEQTSLNHMPVADDFVAVMGMELASGRDFSAERGTDDVTGVIVNERLVARMGWDEPLGKRIQAGPVQQTVIGVVKDFNFKSLHNAVEPFLMYRFRDDFERVPQNLRPFQNRLLVVSVAGDGLQETIAFIRGVFARLDPEHPFEYRFLDDSLDRLYLSERRLMSLIGIFAGVCIFVACLGLFGLAAFTTEQRTREIGVRKVFGASARQIIALLAQHILLLVIIGSLVASLLSYLAMDRWLSGFAYRVSQNPLWFLLAAGAALGVAYATVALQTLRAARSNPVKSLRYE